MEVEVPIAMNSFDLQTLIKFAPTIVKSLIFFSQAIYQK